MSSQETGTARIANQLREIQNTVALRFDMMLDGKLIVSNEIQINIEGEIIEVKASEATCKAGG
jgi:uncharacterized beta-barrel protein YwiB (DUF1934 family)